MKKLIIKKAFERFDNAERPWKLVEKNWYVINKNGALYPLKYIWALTINQEPKSFNTKVAREELTKRGYSVIDTRVFESLNDFEVKIKKSLLDTKENRKKRLKLASKKPMVMLSVIKSYKRNPDVVAEALLKANGVCGQCKKLAPFKKKKDSTPYLEVHHIVQLSNNGDDTVKNTIALCPNCHREAHYG